MQRSWSQAALPGRCRCAPTVSAVLCVCSLVASLCTTSGTASLDISVAQRRVHACASALLSGAPTHASRLLALQTLQAARLHEEGELAAQQRTLESLAAELEHRMRSQQALSEHDGRFAAISQQCLPFRTRLYPPIQMHIPVLWNCDSHTLDSTWLA